MISESQAMEIVNGYIKYTTTKRYCVNDNEKKIIARLAMQGKSIFEVSDIIERELSKYVGKIKTPWGIRLDP